jgi:VanZ family protein
MDPAAAPPLPPARDAGRGPGEDGGRERAPAAGRSRWGVERDRRRGRIRRRQALLLLAAYVGLIALVTLTPHSVDRGVYPLLSRGVVVLQHHGLPWFRYSMIEELANLVMFVPLGMLGVLAVGARRGWAVVLAATAISASVELAQGAFLPARVASLTDVAANGTGALSGVVVAAPAPAVRGPPRVGGAVRLSGVRPRDGGGRSRCPRPRHRRAAARRR